MAASLAPGEGGRPGAWRTRGALSGPLSRGLWAPAKAPALCPILHPWAFWDSQSLSQIASLLTRASQFLFSGQRPLTDTAHEHQTRRHTRSHQALHSGSKVGAEPRCCASLGLTCRQGSVLWRPPPEPSSTSRDAAGPRARVALLLRAPCGPERFLPRRHVQSPCGSGGQGMGWCRT